MASVEAMGRMFSGTQAALSMAGPQNGGQPPTPAAPVSTGSVGTTAAPAGGRTVTKKENGMSGNDQDLSGDDIKNVVYSILFTKRDLEVTLKALKEDVVNYATDGYSYGGLKISQFTSKEEFDYPSRWKNAHYPPNVDPSRQTLRVSDIPDEDQRYIGFSFRVVSRFAKGDADYEKRQTIALEGIERNTRALG